MEKQQKDSLRNMKKINALLVFLISDLVITGISVIDGYIWDIVFLTVGLVSYALVGVLFSIGILHGKKAGREAYGFVFFLLIIGGYFVYVLLGKIRSWILSWPCLVKILVPFILTIIIIMSIILLVLYIKKKNLKNNQTMIFIKSNKVDINELGNINYSLLEDTRFLQTLREDKTVNDKQYLYGKKSRVRKRFC